MGCASFFGYIGREKFRTILNPELSAVLMHKISTIKKLLGGHKKERRMSGIKRRSTGLRATSSTGGIIKYRRVPWDEHVT